MKISHNWLKNYTGLELSPDRIAEMLTGCGLEVEGMELFQSLPGGLANIVIGEVMECRPHTGSDHLSITRVNTGKGDPLQIVCGASNVAAGQKVVVALMGAKLTFGDKEITIQRSKIRGEVSEGMICAEDELGLGTDHSGILVLPADAIPGTPAKDYFGITEDVVFSIGLTPNRADAASHLGVARDLIAVYNNFGLDEPGQEGRISLKPPDITGFQDGDGSFEIPVTVMDAQACPRYSGLTMTGLKVAESPEWLKNHLNAVGLRPINNIVDVTNFVLMELGQPLHAFDAQKIRKGRVVVRKCEDKTEFVTLDGVHRQLSGSDLMICDAEGPMCIGGVFGGLGSGVTEETHSIFLESACFDPVHIRKTSRMHGLQTDASFRFERGTDPQMTIFALKRAALLIQELAGGRISSGISDYYPQVQEPYTVTLQFKSLDRLTGKALNREVVKDILEDLGISVAKFNDSSLEAVIPRFKVDVQREADLIEEILRIYGYNNLEILPEVRFSISRPPRHEKWKIRSAIADLLSGNGFSEIMNNSLTRSAYYQDNGVFNAEDSVKILNPLSRDLDVMRQTLLYGGLETITYNRNRKILDLRLYEFGTTYRKSADSDQDVTPVKGIRESERLALFLTGRAQDENWNTETDPVDIYLLKGFIISILRRLRIDPESLELRQEESRLFTTGLSYYAGNRSFICLGEVHPSVLKGADCKPSVLYADIDLDLLVELLPRGEVVYHELPKYPEVRRDLALLLDREITFASVKELAFRTEQKLLRQVGLFDVYEGEKIGEGKKSYALSFILRDDQKTLTDQEIDRVMERLVKVFSDKLNASIR